MYLNCPRPKGPLLTYPHCKECHDSPTTHALQNQNPFPLAKCYIPIRSFVFASGTTTHLPMWQKQPSRCILPATQSDFPKCEENRLLSTHKNTQYAIIAFWKWGPREVFSMKSNLHFSATNASFLLRRIICTTDLYLKIEGRIYAKMISGDHHRNTKK